MECRNAKVNLKSCLIFSKENFKPVVRNDGKEAIELNYKHHKHGR